MCHYINFWLRLQRILPFISAGHKKTCGGKPGEAGRGDFCTEGDGPRPESELVRHGHFFERYAEKELACCLLFCYDTHIRFSSLEALAEQIQGGIKMRKRVIAVLLAIVLCAGFLPAVALAAGRDTSLEETLAADLKQLGLFQGVSDTDFALGRAPNRTEALVMLIRILGKESEALNGSWKHPFTDVPSWADKYVGYAYQEGLTSGVSNTLFDADSTASSYMYLTFVLRALGYSDTNGLDFTWDNPYGLASEAGVLPKGTNTVDFWRADVVRVSYAALAAKMKGSDKALCVKLIEAGVFTQEQYNKIYDPDVLQGSGSGEQPTQQKALTAEQIADVCAPAVFYVGIYGLNGELAGSGSGFFISSDGLAVTNFHVAANSSQLVISTTDGKTYSDVKIIDSDIANDLALLKVGGSGFPYLELASSPEVVQGQKVYAIGSPLGLENTMSEGIISNPSRTLDGTKYIQISVPIDHGSSGGALINESGKVIGVTTAGLESTGDLNLAIPSSCINLLDQSSDADFVLWQRDFYPGFEHAYDFGAFSGVKLLSAVQTPLGYFVEYDANDFHRVGEDTEGDRYADTIFLYRQALLNEGFVQTQKVEECFGQFDTSTELVYFMSDLDKMIITVIAEYIPQYYAEVPALPDFGWYIGTVSNEAYEIDRSLTYSYKISNYFSSYNDFLDVLALYFELLEDEGFTCVYSEADTALFEGNGLSVVFIVDETMTFYVDAAPLY